MNLLPQANISCVTQDRVVTNLKDWFCFLALIYTRNMHIVMNFKLAAQFCHGFFGPLSAQVCCGLISDQYKVIREQSCPYFDAVRFHQFLILNLLELDYERVFDAKHGIGRFVRIILKIKCSANMSQLTGGFLRKLKLTDVIRGSYPSFLNMKCMWLGRYG